MTRDKLLKNHLIALAIGVSILAIVLPGCSPKDAAPVAQDPPKENTEAVKKPLEIVVTRDNTILAYPSRAPIALEKYSNDLENIGCPDPMHGPPTETPSLIVHHDEGASCVAFDEIFRHAGCARIALAYQGVNYRVLTYPMEILIEDEPSEMELEDQGGSAVPDSSQGKKGEDPVPDPPNCFEVRLLKGEIRYGHGPKIADLNASCKAYMAKHPNEPVAALLFTKIETLTQLCQIVKQLTEAGFKDVHLAMLKDAFLELDP